MFSVYFRIAHRVFVCFVPSANECYHEHVEGCASLCGMAKVTLFKIMAMNRTISALPRVGYLFSLVLCVLVSFTSMTLCCPLVTEARSYLLLHIVYFQTKPKGIFPAQIVTFLIMDPEDTFYNE